MTKFELPEMSPRIFSPAPMVELEVGAAGATGAGEGAMVAGTAATGAEIAAGVAGVVAGTGVSGVLTDEIAD